MPRLRSFAAAIGLILCTTPPGAAIASAHIVRQVGPYSVAVGWLHEPTYVGLQNAVQVIIKDSRGTPVSDLSPDDLKVVVSIGGASSDPMALVPTFDADTGLGIPGDYEAPIIPTAPGAYTFHVTGAIHGTTIDETASSSDTTFESAISPSGIQFPVKQPDLGEVATRLERMDSRISDGKAAAASAADDARSAAAQALVISALVGGLGVVLGAAGVVLALRRRPMRAT